MQKLAIIGGGASGLFLASFLARTNSYDVTLFEKGDHLGKKILVTGNGKCNITNMNMNSSFYNSDISGVIDTFNPHDLIELLSSYGIKVYVDPEGRVYPYSRQASSIVNVLLESLGSTRIFTNSLVTGLERVGEKFIVSYNYSQDTFDKVVLASGGKAYTGSDFFKEVGKFGLNIINDKPALCALNVLEYTKPMSGLRVEAEVKVNEFCESGEVLFKDDGLSGIVIFNASRFAKPGDIIHLDLAKGLDLKTEAEIKNNLPKMVAKDVIDRAKAKNIELDKVLHNYTFMVKSRYSYKNSQIMQGGIGFSEVDHNTFESKKVKGLYILGEALDVDGACGGYNMHFAIASAYICAKGLKQ